MEKVEKKYVATVMLRTYVTMESYLFTCLNAVVGDYDEKHKIFTDTKGNDYIHMTSDSSLDSDVAYSVFNIKTIDEMKKLIRSDKDLDGLLGEYEDYCKRLIYYVGYDDGYNPFVHVLNTEDVRNSLVYKEKEAFKGEADIKKALRDLIKDSIDDKYSKKELANIVKELESVKDEAETSKGTLETKIAAIENNRSFVEQLNSELGNPNNVVMPTVTYPPAKKPDQTIKVTPEAKAKIEKKQEPKQKEEKKEVQAEPKKEERINIEETFNKVTKTLIAQDEPTKRVITELARKEMCPRKRSEAILLYGPTGVGKTKMVKLIAANMNKPLIIVDSTQLTIPGYVGKNIEEVLWDLYIKCGKDLKKAENAIIYFDEIDKKGSEKKDDVSGQGVLNVLLPFIEGTTYDAALDSRASTTVVKMNTTNMTVIVGGAFSDVLKHLVLTSQIGFDTEKYSTTSPVYREAETKDFVEYGMMTNEFMGRVTPIRLNDLGREEVKRVMLESDESALKTQVELFKELGVNLTYTSGYVDKVVDDAFKLKTGARSLNGIIDRTTWRAFGEAHSHPGKYKSIQLTEETVEDPTKYIVEEEKPKVKSKTKK